MEPINQMNQDHAYLLATAEAFEQAAATARKLLDAANDGSEDERMYRMGLAAYTLHQNDMAEQYLCASQGLDPQAQTAARLAMTYWHKQRLDDAQRWIEEAIKLDPEGQLETLIARSYPRYPSLLAAILLARGQVDSAQKAAEAALKTNRSDHLAAFVLGRSLVFAGEPAKALEVLPTELGIETPITTRELEATRAMAERLRAADLSGLPFASSTNLMPRVEAIS